ncbi:hypothetical protein BJX99DRAFT_169722 [Aspergillus californicus]
MDPANPLLPKRLEQDIDVVLLASRRSDCIGHIIHKWGRRVDLDERGDTYVGGKGLNGICKADRAKDVTNPIIGHQVTRIYQLAVEVDTSGILGLPVPSNGDICRIAEPKRSQHELHYWGMGSMDDPQPSCRSSQGAQEVLDSENGISWARQHHRLVRSRQRPQWWLPHP